MTDDGGEGGGNGSGRGSGDRGGGGGGDHGGEGSGDRGDRKRGRHGDNANGGISNSGGGNGVGGGSGGRGNKGGGGGGTGGGDMMDLFTCPPAPADYVLVGGLRVVKPYAFDFVCHVKQRMAGRTVVDMFAHEFPARPLAYYQVGRCRLTVSTPVLKARLVSALEAKMSRTAFKGCFQFQLAPLQPGGARTRAAAGPTHAQLPADAGQGGERGTCSWEEGGRKGTGTGDGEWRKGRKGRKWRNGGVWKRGGRRQQ